MSEYMITNDAQAERALRRIRAIRAERERLTNACKEQIAIYKRRLELLESDSAAREQFYTDKLGEYYNTLPGDSLRRTKTGSTSYKLLGGTLRDKQMPMSYDHSDEALAGELEDMGMGWLVTTVRKPHWGNIKKMLQVNEATGLAYVETIDPETGELVSHALTSVTPVPQTKQFEVQLDDIGDVDTVDDMEGEDDE